MDSIFSSQQLSNINFQKCIRKKSEETVQKPERKKNEVNEK